jgi:signal transduction histidine kinase
VDTLISKSVKGLVFLTIRDITPIIKGFQKVQDNVYLTAIENNFSHELMTPLNPIFTGSEMLKRQLIAAFKADDLELENPTMIEGHQEQALATIGQNKEACNLLKGVIGIEQSAKSLWYFNTN